MAGGRVGTLDEFESSTETVSNYVERVQMYFEANDIADAKKVSTFLSCVGKRTFAVLRDLVSPESPKDKTLDELVAVLKRHYKPVTLVIAERFSFHRRCQQQGESVAEFAAELKKLSSNCKFGTYLDEALRDRLVCGLRSEATQKKLLTEVDLTFKRALEIAQSNETASMRAKQLQNPKSGRESEKPVYKVEDRGQSGASSNGCFCCGKLDHKKAQCKFKGCTCHNCGQTGHLQRVCRKRKVKKPTKPPQSQKVKTVVQEDPTSEEVDTILHVGSKRDKPISVDVRLDGKPLCMELDTGASRSLISEVTYKALFKDRPLGKSKVRLRTYSGEMLKVLGEEKVVVTYGDQRAELSLVVVEGDGANLFGRNWLEHLRLDWAEVKAVRDGDLAAVLEQNSVVFGQELGQLKGYEASIHVDPQAQPRFCKPRSVPYAMQSKVNEELDRLVDDGILEPVQYSEWAAPVVAVWKPGGKSIRLCGDFKQTVNQVSRLDRYPIPKIEDLLATLKGGKYFSKLDLQHAYQQLKLDEKSQQYVVVNTKRGLFRYTRLPFGIASAPGIFQRVMESVVRGIPGVIVYLDDILISGGTQGENVERLQRVLSRLREVGLRLKREKCVFLATSVDYLGFKVDSEGVHPLPEKVRAVQEAPTPRNVGELKSFLGLLSYYSRFLPDMATLLAPLYRLLKKGEKWCWLKEQEAAFQEAKERLMSSQVLVHFDPKLEIRLACDASDYGIGAVLSHRFPDGSEKPVAFMSRTLNDAEKKYSQIEKEGLACVVGVTRFHSYLYGHHFVLQTDHKPLMTLFNERKLIPQQASNRIQRWAWKLAAYEYTMAFRTSKQHANADALSRLPLREAPEESPDLPEVVLMVENVNNSPISAHDIAVRTKRDPVLSQVYHYIQEGWPTSCAEEVKPYEVRRDELSTQHGCVVWGDRVVIPPSARGAILFELHAGHPGVSRMKALARSFVWWPGIDRAIVERVEQCSTCQLSRAMPPRAPLQPWSWPTRPWARIHLDFAGPLDGKMYLVVVDAHSKWLEVIQMGVCSATTTVQALRTLFARFGIPESIVSDNGPQFVALEFQQFCKANGIQQIRVAPYHPSSNGLAERAVRIFKEGLKKQTTGSLSDRLARTLFEYRRTPHTTTGVSPAELMFGRPLRSRLSLVRPDLQQKVLSKQVQQKLGHDKAVKHREFSVGEEVLIRMNKQDKWKAGKILEKLGPLSFRVKLLDGQCRRCHVDQIRKNSLLDPDPVTSEDSEAVVPAPTSVETPPVEDPPAMGGAGPTEQTLREPRYPSRVRHPPDRFST